MPTSFGLILDDTSPVVNYYPFAETLGAPDLLAGWNSYFTQSGFLTQLGQKGLGDSYHVTSLDGATLTIPWFGTGISVFGMIADAAFEVSIDGGPPSIGLPRQDILTEFQDLDSNQHLLSLIFHLNATNSHLPSYAAFDRVALNISTGLNGATVSSEVLDVNSPRWNFSGEWSDSSNLSRVINEPYRVSTKQGSTATIVFTGSAVSLTGIRNDTHGHYNVTLDGKTTTFAAHSDWLLINSTLFLQAGLNETASHSLTVTNADNATFAFTGINITHVGGGTPALSQMNNLGPGITTGTLIGVTFAVILGVLVVAIGIMRICFQLYRKRNPKVGGTLPSATKRNIDGDKTERPVVLMKSTKAKKPDPPTPVSYQRSSKILTAASPSDPAERRRSRRVSWREDVVFESPTTHDPGPPRDENHEMGKSSPSTSTAKHLNVHSRKQNTIVGTTPQGLRIEIPPEKQVAVSRSSSQHSRTSPLLLNRQLPPRNPQSPSEEMLPSVSTIQFSPPWETK